MIRRAFALSILLFFFTTSPAQAEEPFTIGSQPVWFILGGVSSGGTVATDRRGAFVGGELSLARLRDRTFLGFYADSYYDFGIEGTYLTAGPELGFIRRSPSIPIAIGLDGGAAFRFGDDSDIGGAGRLSLIFAGTFSIYTRYMHFGSGEDDRVVQVGLSLKFPLLAPFGAGAR